MIPKVNDDILYEVWNLFNRQKVPDQNLNKNVARMKRGEFRMMKINI